MKNRFHRSLRFKLIFYILMGGAIALLLANLLLPLGQRLLQYPFFQGILSFLARSIGTQNAVYIAVFLFFVLFILIVSRGSIKYLEAIVDGIGKIEHGDLNVRVDVRSQDELGVLASAVNSMADKLQYSISEERKSETAKKELISSVSHDLRTPLTSVIGFLGLLIHRGTHADEDLERYALIAHKKALRLQELIDDLFEYTRVSYSGIRMDRERLDMQELLQQLIEEYVPVFEEQEITIKQFYSGKKFIISGDGDLLVRLFENLIQNAIRYGKEGKILDLKIMRKDGMVAVQIINHGNPIPDNKLPYIFDRFYRAEEFRSRETGGSGLGLAIAKNIAELHGGHIQAFSDPSGTCFEVSLPTIS